MTNMNFRIGNGIDVHPLEKGIPFIIGGVEIESEMGICGHSDGDILIHAIVDALLGALSLGDIGSFFPSNEKWENYNSSIFLNDTIKKLKTRQYYIVNIDSTIILQNPKINSYIPKIKRNLAELMQLEKERISVKASTTDYLGFIGENKGIAVLAVALICRG